MNLFFLLLVARHYLTKDQIRDSIQDYRDSSQAAFERKFERDKEELRDIGIVIETGRLEAFFGDDVGYRIRRDETELPDLELSREEAAVIGLAGRLWNHAGLAAESATAIVKLKAIGVEVESPNISVVEPRVSAHEPSFDSLLEAVTRRIEVEFDYRRPGRETLTRTVQPWNLITSRDRWYLAGFDRHRGEPRLFRLSRIIGQVKYLSSPGGYVVPEDADLRSVAAALEPPTPTQDATVVVASGRAQSLRRRATSTTTIDSDWDELVIGYRTDGEFAAELAGYGAAVRVTAPDSLRDALIGQLRAAIAATEVTR